MNKAVQHVTASAAEAVNTSHVYCLFPCVNPNEPSLWGKSCEIDGFNTYL